MNAHVDDQLFELALGLLGEDAPARRHLVTCARCRNEVAAATEALAAYGAAVPPLPPPAALRERLLVSSRHGRPLVSFAARVGRLFALPVAEATRLLTSLADPTTWIPGPVPGFRMAGLAPGPGAAARLGCFLRGAPGVVFRRHRHTGWEQVLVLQGGFRETDLEGGQCDYWAGDDAPKPPGSAHELLMLEGADCIAAILTDGFELV